MAAGLLGDTVQLCMPDVPFLCHFERAVGLTDSYPYKEIVDYLKVHRDKIDTVYNTLTYFDAVHFAARIQADAFFSTALMDGTCPPSTVFAAYNRIQTEKDIRVYRFNEHDGGSIDQQRAKVAFVNARWK